MNTTATGCETCAHSHYLEANEQMVCMHPRVTERSVITGRLIGVDAGTVRYSDRCIDREQCGPSGRWWQAKTRDPGATG